MRTAVFAILGVLAADITPRGSTIYETRWPAGDFVAVSTESLDRLVDSGPVVGLKISGVGESCLLRRHRFTLEMPCRAQFRVRWSDVKYGAAYPSIHLVFNPPALDDEWWKKPNIGGAWKGIVPSFLFHFATDGNSRRFGLTAGFEDAPRRHEYSAPENHWFNLEIMLALGRTQLQS